MKKQLTLIQLLCLLIISSYTFSCKTNLLVLEDVLPSVKGIDFSVKFEQPSLTLYQILLNVEYEIRNPYKTDLPIPDHKMGILINNKELDMFVNHESVVIPAKSSRVLSYSFVLDSEELMEEFMGKENEIIFHTSIKLDLTDYGSMLPNYQLTVTESFNLESDKLKPVVNNLIQKKIGTYELKYEKSAKLKVPSLPTISVSSEPIEITLLGDGISFINPNNIKEALIPFGDLLVNGELDGLKDPFIDAVVNATVTIPAPTFTDWTATKEVKMEQQVIDLLSPLVPDIDAKWEQTKELLYRDASVPVTDYFVENFIAKYINNQAPAYWETFKVGYNDLKNTRLPDEIPGPQTAGFEIAIPFSFRNNNEFPMTIPVFRSSVFFNYGQPFSMFVRPKGTSEIPLDVPPSSIAEIPPKTTVTLYAVFSFNMQQFNQGLYSLFMKSQFEPNLRGIMGYDFGYGPLYIGYDLQNMELNYK